MPDDLPAKSPRPFTACLGEPALLLVESLIHEFIANGVLDRTRAISVVDIAIEAQITHCEDRDEDAATDPAIAALSRVHTTLSIDAASFDGAGLPLLADGDGGRV